nr:DEAD-box type RNA helicase [Polyrhizophydium stewartii]
MRGGSALAAQGVYAALLRFREQPHNEELRTDFLDRLCAFVNGLPHGEHFFHNHPDAAVEAMLVLSLTKSNDAVECSQASMARQLAACLECITVYHDARSQFFSKYALIYHPDDLEQLFLADLRRCKDNPSEERVVRQGTLCPIFDILNYPAPLQNRALDGMFTELLMTVQQKSRLKLRDSVFPGIVLLCVHEKTIIREWAQSCIVRAGLPIQMSKIGALSPILADIIGHLRRVIRIEPPQKSAQAMAAKCAWNFTDDEAELWRGVMCICSMDQLRAKMFCDWMLQFLLRTPSPPDGQAPDTSWIVIELRLFFQLSHMWQPCFKNMLHVTLLLLLDSHLTTLSLTYCILGQLLADQHKCISTAMRHHVLAAVSEDANVLCLTTQPDCIGGQPQLHDDVWRGLASYDPPADLVADLLPIVAQAGFSPLICQGNSAAVSHTENNGKACSADDFSVPSAARLAASICRWIESALGDATFSVDIDTLLALLMFNDISIQQAAHKLALASTSSESYQQAVRGLVRRYSSDFLPRLFSRLSGFKKCCALYLDCLDSARGIIDLLQAVAECVVLLPDEGVVLHLGSSDSQQNPTFSTWLYSFLASFSILDAALIWAQDARFPSHDIKRLVLESLHLMRKLLPGHRSVIPEPIRVDVIRDWSEECATSLIKWTRTTDPRLRSDALSLLIDILAIATSFDATFGSELVGALSQLGGLSPHMTDEQNLVLTVWLSKQKPQSLEPDAAQALAPPSSGVMTTAAHVQATASRSHDIGNTPEPHADQWLNDDIEFDDLERLEQQALRLELGSNDEVMMTEAATLLAKTGKKAAPSGKLSKLQQMRAEAALESRRLSSNRLPHGGRPQKPVAVVQIEPSEPQLVAPDPPREKRKIQTIDIPVDRPGSTRIGRLIQTAAMTGAEAKPLRSIKDLYRIVLEWDMKLDPSKRPPNLAALKLGKIPDSFRSFADYLHSFEPLLLLECWQQFVQAREELKREDSLCMVVQTLTMQWSDNLIVLLTDVRSKASLLGRIKDISYKGAEAQSKWDAVQVFSLTTAIREYKSLLSLQSIPLSREILQPSQTRQPAPDSAKIAEYQRQLNVNIPQAKAIAAAIEQRSGFVLIQGKTKTILGLVGALQRMATSISVPSGSDAHGTRPFAAPVTNPSKRRLLCCAPSNAAIDEIARRLMDGILNAKGQLYKPSIVRVGTSAIHSDVRDVTLVRAIMF